MLTVCRLPGLSAVLHSSSDLYSPPLPETLTPLLKSVLTSSNPAYTHVFSAHSSAAKSILPRVAAVLDAPQVSDITSISHEGDTTTFERPIYAGNAIATVTAGPEIPLKFVTVRGTAFKALSDSESASGEVEATEIPPVEENTELAKHLSTELTASDRPDLGLAKTIVSGGRALKNKETFYATLDPLCEALNAALGASRAAVDAGYADNSLQIGQTGKIVAPNLYVAVGISGAIQHLAGMKDSGCIVAINKVSVVPDSLPLGSISLAAFLSTFDKGLVLTRARIGCGCTDFPSRRPWVSRRFVRNRATAGGEAEEIDLYIMRVCTWNAERHVIIVALPFPFESVPRVQRSP